MPNAITSKISSIGVYRRPSAAKMALNLRITSAYTPINQNRAHESSIATFEPRNPLKTNNARNETQSQTNPNPPRPRRLD